MAETDIAVVGMACRLPGAPSPAEFWRLLHDGREARVLLSDEHLRAAGVPPAVLADPDYVKAAMLLSGIDQFDAGFFGLSPRDAALFDPQHRVFLECAWEAFEHAGHVPERFVGRIGVYAGCGMNTYLLHNIVTNPDLVRRIGMFLIRHTGNDKDFLATRTSYQFDLRGPSVNVLTACSTSLVAIHQAAHSLLAGECDMALAGGVTILVPQDRGYLYRDGEILSPDGKCRAFDADSKGTIFGSGAGIVVLRRLQDALADGDHIHAIVAGSAVNNDGGRKVGFLAPSVDGYAEVVAEALALADLSAAQIQYVEAHGTGTPVGDPIEIEALSQAFRASTSRTGFCGIGSVKTNIGHLDTAAGVAGFQKVVLAMQHGELPASLNFQRPNPLIDFGKSPFRVIAAREAWPRPAGGVRIAGCSALGVGGTNAHVLVKEAVHQAPEPAVGYPRRCHLLPISGKVEAAATGNAQALGAHLREHGANLRGGELADVAWTVQWGRKPFAQRGFVVGASAAELGAALLAPEWKAQLKKVADRAPSVVFLFPGGGAQYPGMARGLYECEPVFRAAADSCLAALPAAAAALVRDLLFGELANPEHGVALERPSLALPALFLVEYALARTLQSFGIVADAMLGHSMGEYVAACLGGTFTVAQGMQVVRLRGELFEQVQEGAMLTVPMTSAEVVALGDSELSLAAANAPQLCAVAGTVATIDRVEQSLQLRGLDVQRLRIAVAAHSHLLDPILDRFRAGLRAMSLKPAQQPWVSNVTGDWIDPQRAADPEYWVEHLRRTVRFQDGIATLLASGDRVFVEVGPGKALTSLVRMHGKAAKSQVLVTLPHAKEAKAADAVALEAVGRLWQLGVEVDWRAFHGGVPRRRVPLPTYAFQRQRHWIEPGAPLGQDGVLRGDDEPLAPSRLPDSDWLRRPAFRNQELPAAVAAVGQANWLCVGGGVIADELARQVGAAGGLVTRLRSGPEANAGAEWTLPLADARAWGRALEQITAAHGAPRRLLFLVPLTEGDGTALVQILLAMWQALGRAEKAALRCLAVTSGACRVAAEPMERPGQGVVSGFLRVVPREYPGARTRSIDLDPAALVDLATAVATLRREIENDDVPLQVAVRGGARFVQELLAVEVAATAPTAAAASPWRQHGVYLLSGGLGGIGLLLAEHLASIAKARLVLLGRRGLPPRELWDRWLELRPGDRHAQLIERVRGLEALGAIVEVVAADVTDRTAMAAVVQSVRARWGALHGIVHAAGVLDDGLIQLRTGEQAARMLAPKLRGAEVLDAVTAEQPPELFVVFGSTSGLAGIPGQSDYAAANAGLDAFAHWRSGVRPGRTLAVDWGLWHGAGMVGNARGAGAAPAQAWLGSRSEHRGAVQFHGTWSPATHWQLAEHRIVGGDWVLPGTAHLELMTAAVQAVADVPGITLERVEFLTPLAFPGGAARSVFVVVNRGRDGFEVVVQSAEAVTGDHYERTTHARCFASTGASGAELVDVAAWRCAAATVVPMVANQARFVAFGPRWQCVERVRIGEGVVVGDLRLPTPFAADHATHPLHPALLDMALGCGIRLLAEVAPMALFVPVSIDEVIVAGRLSGPLVARVVLRSCDRHARLGKVDVTVASPEGIVLIELRGLQLFGVRSGFGGAEATAAPTTATNEVAAKSPMPPLRASVAAPAVAAPRIRAILSRGITGPEGMLGLQRALSTGAPQVVVSSLDIARTANWLSLPPELPRAANVPPIAATDGVTVEAPRDQVEQKLAAGFQELLGIDQPGLDQDFFELGGHSLLAVRLFARIHGDFGLDLELATLLVAGTVRKLAGVVRAELKLPEPGSAPVRSVAARKGQYVVPIQTEGARPKLFLVHGAGGNVLGFRDLSHYFGKDQPVYALQARGVDGKQAPHQTIAEMATAYLAELREVQPRGPYCLGGYSGGGLIAYELAQQLHEVGETVAFLGLIDSWSPQMPRRSKLVRALMHVGRLLRRGPKYPLDIVKLKLQRMASAKQNDAARQQGGVMPVAMRGQDVQFAFERAFERHVVRPYAGPMWLFRCADHDLGTRYVFDERLGWAPFVQQIEVAVCAGNHFTMCTEPNVQILCRQIMAALDAAIAVVAPG